MVLARAFPKAHKRMRGSFAGVAFGLSAALVAWWESQPGTFDGTAPAVALGVFLLCAAALKEGSRLLGCALAAPALLLGGAMLAMESAWYFDPMITLEHAVAKQMLDAAMVCVLAIAMVFLRCRPARRQVNISHLLAFLGLGLAMESLTFALFDLRMSAEASRSLVPGCGMALATAMLLERPNPGLRWLVFSREEMGRQVRRQIASVALVPLVMGGVFVTYTYAGSPDHTSTDLMVLFTMMVWQVLLFSGLGAIRLERLARARRQAETRLEHRAMSDGLTGLANRTAFERRFHDAAERVRLGGAWTFSLVILDVDHFKQVNDTYGHAAGDAVLRALGTGLRGVAPRGAFLARLGGEEFAMILAGEVAEAVPVAQEMRDWIEQCKFDGVVWNGAEIGVTASFGVSDYCPRDTLSETYARVDRALYLAKARGRNQVAVLPRAIGGCNLMDQKRNFAAGLCGEEKCAYSRDSW